MDSFMSWIGGKKALRKKIVEQFPEPGTYNRYIEVFGGAGWVLFSSDSHAKMEVYNDCDYIRELYREYTILEVDRMHNLVQKEVKPRYRELIIKNFV